MRNHSTSLVKYLLLTPLKGSDFNIKNKELVTAINSCGCLAVLAKDVSGSSIIYVAATTTSLIEDFCSEHSIEGIVMEYTGIFDQVIED